MKVHGIVVSRREWRELGLLLRWAERGMNLAPGEYREQVIAAVRAAKHDRLAFGRALEEVRSDDEWHQGVTTQSSVLAALGFD